MQIDQMESQIVKKKRSRSIKGNSDSIPAFLLKTYEIIDVQKYGFQNPQNNDVISWNEDGTAFIVKKVNEFSDVILPKSFKHSNFASFVRQLNMYDFHKTRHDNNENEFKHKLFRRGQKSLLSQIKRKTNDQKEQNSLSLIKTDVVRNGTQEIPELVMQMVKLSNKQNELEKLIKILIKQNEKIQKENKYLWGELMKNKYISLIQRHKNETTEEQIMKWVLSSLQANKQNGKVKNVQGGNHLLMLKQTSENDDDQQQKIFQNEKINYDSLPPSLIAQSIEASFEKLTKAQIMQGLMNALSQNKDKKYKYEEDMSFDDDEDYPIYKKVDTTHEEQGKQEGQVMLYSEPFHYFPKFDDNYIINESPHMSRKNSYCEQDPIPQFFEEQL